jgi:Asp-tRNA(Asn)/Glu-tRNA(Gln) amidotransferase A subunit family amidase
MAPYDALILPTVPIAPPKISDFATDEAYRRLNYLLLRNPSAINFLDGCAISLPCHAKNQPPAGLMLAAPSMHDARLLATAREVEAVLF